MLERRAAELSGIATWSRPQGGFFVAVDLPFVFDLDCLESCARDDGVICCPMTFFALGPGRERQIRLSFSYVSPEQIEEGVARLARFVRRRGDASRELAPAAPPARTGAGAGARGGTGAGARGGRRP